jgi:hypothetical protein
VDACAKGSSMCESMIEGFANHFPKEKQKKIIDGLMRLIQNAKEKK